MVVWDELLDKAFLIRWHLICMGKGMWLWKSVSSMRSLRPHRWWPMYIIGCTVPNKTQCKTIDMKLYHQQWTALKLRSRQCCGNVSVDPSTWHDQQCTENALHKCNFHLAFLQHFSPTISCLVFSGANWYWFGKKTKDLTSFNLEKVSFDEDIKESEYIYIFPN